MNTSSQSLKLIAFGIAVCAVMLIVIGALLWKLTLAPSARSPVPSPAVPLALAASGSEGSISPPVVDEAKLTSSLYAAAKPYLDELSSDTLSKEESATEVSPEQYSQYQKIYGKGPFYDFVRKKSERTETSHNIIKTDSLTSPYLGSVIASYSTTFGPSYIQKEKAANSKLEPETRMFHKKRLDFAYQQGEWVFKSATDVL